MNRKSWSLDTAITGKTKIDTTGKKDTLKYPIKDRRGPSIAEPSSRSAIDLKDPANINKTVEYDPVTKQYTVQEKIGDQYYRNPTYLNFDEFYKLQSKESEQSYWQKRASALGNLNQRAKGPALYNGSNLFDRIFGGSKVDIRPQGSLDLTFGYQGQNIKNPVLVEQARKNGGFNFDMGINMNVVGKIGDKLKLITNYNTQSAFDFENQVKLEYTGYNDEIIKKIEAGNVSFPLRSSLITGIQSLFGVKTQLQFGRLTVTSVLSSQKSQKQNLMLKGGTMVQDYNVRADEYEDNRHFLLAQYFRDNFDYSMSNLPVIRSLANITRVEVWVTNKTGATTQTRDIVGLMDLGESKPWDSLVVHPTTSSKLPDRAANDLYTNLISNQANRNTGIVVSRLLALGLKPVSSFEKTFARKLDSTEYIYNKQLGYISLNQQLQADEVLAVAYQYTYNGKVYQVGEFSQDVPPDQNNSANQPVLFLKLLKATSARPTLPIWDLMMKNVYATGAYQVNKEDFRMDVYYKDPGSQDRPPSDKRYLPDAKNEYAGAPIISILNLDRLNNQLDPQPDGVFDYVDGYTINSLTGKIMFPVLEPFAGGIKKAFGGDAALEKQYLYRVLYDSIKVVAQQFQQLNRYVIRGSYKSANSSEINLGSGSIPPGSVTVTAGGQQLRENVDFIIDYNLGRLKIINAGILNSGVPINVQFENNSLFGQQVRNYFGTRLDYVVNDKLSLGGTVVRMSERPYYQKVNYGEDPIKNTMVGLDANYASEWKGLSRLLDKLPNFTPSAPSSILFTGEVARLFPGHNKLINQAGSKSGTAFIDDFEGVKSGYDLKFPATNWALATTPKDARDASGNVLFPEADYNNLLDYGKNRAKLAWYIIEPTLQLPKSPNLPAGITAEDQSDPRVRLVYQKEVFKNRSTDFGQSQLSTLDLAYYPTERGPYNFTSSTTSMDRNGFLNRPKTRWGGIMRAIDNSDFETANIEYIEFWIQDPFIRQQGSNGGSLYFNLGNVSEDILKDSKKFFENGMPDPNQNPNKIDSSKWGRVPKFQQQITQAFDNDPNIRSYQDVGYDGLKSSDEASFFRSYMDTLSRNFAGSPVMEAARRDPANDDYEHYRSSTYDARRTNILGRYKNYSNPEGNSPVSDNKSQFSSAATNIPESEDLNRDNTMNETEEYFQYRIDLKPNMAVGSNFIVDKIEAAVDLPNGSKTKETWYQFKVPVSQYDHKVGNIPDFKSIRFMRMFLTNFTDSVVVRFAKLELVRSQWRRYMYELQPGDPVPLDQTTQFNSSAVNIEENSSRTPIPYVLPPGVVRQNTISTNNTTLQLNEQSLSVQVCNLQDGEIRALYKTLNMDLRQYKKMEMYLHAEAVGTASSLKDGQVQAVIRIGSDFVSNYYEYRIPLKVTDWNGPKAALDIWPDRNNMELVLASLSQLKQKRNMCDSCSPLLPYPRIPVADQYGNFMSVVGNPSLGDARTMMIGIANPKDDGMPRCAEVWLDELRLSDFDEKGGYAAQGRVDIQLADLGTISVSGNMHTAGFGNIDQRVNDRFRDNFLQYDAAANLDLGKLLPKKIGMSIPVYAGYSQSVSNPEYDPYDLDIKLKDKLALARNRREKDSIKREAQDFTSITSLNFTNVRKMNVAGNGNRRHIWDIENFDVSYSFSKINKHNPLIENDQLVKHRGGLGYNYAGQPRYLEPFKKLIKSKSRWLDLIRDFNINYVPAIVSFRADVSRQFGVTRIRNVGGDKKYQLPETYDKYFTFDRYYTLKWDLSRSINIEFNAVNNARIDEPSGRINTGAKKDTVRGNFFKGGRTTNYMHNANFTYTLPTAKFPALSWTNIAIGYSTEYRWIGASRLALYLGNAIENTQQKTLTAELKFSELYNKFKILREINARQPQQNNNNNNNNKAAAGQKDQQTASNTTELSPWVKGILKPLMMLKRIGFNYNENAGTRLPGYIDSTKVLGMNWASMSPGLAFVLGHQPDKKWLDKFAAKGLITRDPSMNIQFQQQFTQRWDAQAQLEPLNDLRIDLTMTKSFTKTHTELFKNMSEGGGTDFQHLNPYDAGGFEITYIALKTMFGKINSTDGISETFRNFEAYRRTISQRLAEENPYNKDPSVPTNDPKDPAYRYGYTRYAQDVLIPAFLAAYTGKSPDKIGLLNQGSGGSVKSNPFKNYFPKPNWRLTYNGLNKLEPFRSILTNFTITHGYVGNLSMNSYNTSMYYEDPRLAGYPAFRDTVSGNYYPYYVVPNITMTEAFSPLLGVDLTFTNSLNARVEFRKSRSLSLSLIDYQLTELRSNEIIIGAGYRVRGLQLPFAFGRGGKKLQNDLNFRLDLSFRDDKTANNRLDADLAIPTSGQKVIGIAPSIDYIVNNRLNLRFFYDRRQTIPVISTSYPIINTKGGITFRFVLSQ
ncbi:T9SS outer membrane translocon Sov/SprA [Chitinophaga nivalis]|uniref:Cell surface protein SprA n=1 Tax=Chitinophaga nivalis TaxID=2991709 RepID=A0ABT3ISX3_9BACT|nr:cell surface protein SprA [Chitinophaga nivalis]MCW3463314.1 cell surface protein SprA [Chitinophaga nivalis]MCW3486996.1 cell surface protein SprA [Chitinophaga nivalis]